MNKITILLVLISTTLCAMEQNSVPPHDTPPTTDIQQQNDPRVITAAHILAALKAPPSGKPQQLFPVKKYAGNKK